MPVTCELCKKRAQIFTVDGQFTPTKASVYLRTSLYDNSSYFNLSDTPVFEVANFSEREQGTTAQVYAGDNAVAGFSSKVYMYSDSNGGSSDYPILYYPIKAGISGSYDVYIRKYNSANTFDVNILVDGVVQDSISDAIDASFDWSSALSITMSDTSIHTLGIQVTSNEAHMDQIIIQDAGDAAPVGAQTLTDSPYNTVHAQLYDISGGIPNQPLVVHDYKNTITDIANDGWYNFDLNFLTTAGVSSFNDELYALVLYACGAREKNFVAWELVDSNEYLNLPVAAEN